MVTLPQPDGLKLTRIIGISIGAVTQTGFPVGGQKGAGFSRVAQSLSLDGLKVSPNSPNDIPFLLGG